MNVINVGYQFIVQAGVLLDLKIQQENNVNRNYQLF